MTLSADLKAIHEAGAVLLPEIAGTYDAMTELTATLSGDHGTLVRPGSPTAWGEALASLNLLLGMSRENTRQAGDVLRLVAQSYAATDEEAAAKLSKATEGASEKTYLYGEWR